MKQIGQYRVDRPLGAGDYSEVFRCLDGDVPVAVKVFRIRSTRLKSLIRKCDGELTARLRRIFVSEATLLASFSHRHIVDVKVRSTLPDGSPYFVMPFLPHDLAKDIWPWKSMAFANTPMADRRSATTAGEGDFSPSPHPLRAERGARPRDRAPRRQAPERVDRQRRCCRALRFRRGQPYPASGITVPHHIRIDPFCESRTAR